MGENVYHIRKIELLSILLLSTLLIFGFFNIERTVHRLEEDMSTVVVPDIEFGGNTYSVRSGVILRNGAWVRSPFTKLHVLRIAKYSVENRIDPLLGMGFTDIDAFKESLQVLEISRNEYSLMYEQKGLKDEATHIRNTLYPIDFLLNMGDLEALRRKVLATPNTENVKEYNEYLGETIREYLLYIKRLREMYRDFARKKDVELVFWGGIATYQSFIDSLSKAEENMLLKNNIRKARYDCFLGRNTCTLLSSLMRERFSAPERVVFESPKLPPHITTNYRIMSTYRTSLPEYDISKETPPIIALKESNCTPEEMSRSYQYLWWVNVPHYISKSVRTNTLDDILFYDVVNASKEKLAGFLGEAKKDNLEYIYYPPTKFYGCPNPGEDIALTNTLYVIRAVLKETPLASRLPIGMLPQKDLERLIALENEIITTDILYEESVEEYVNEWKEVLLLYGETVLAEGITEEKVIRIENIINTVAQKSAHLDELMISAARMNITNLAVVEKVPTRLDYLFMLRGYPYLFLILFNESVSDEDISFYAEKKQASFQSLGIVSYNNDLSHRYSELDILEKMLRAREFEDILWGSSLERITTPAPSLDTENRSLSLYIWDAFQNIRNSIQLHTIKK